MVMRGDLFFLGHRTRRRNMYAANVYTSYIVLLHLMCCVLSFTNFHSYIAAAYHRIIIIVISESHIFNMPAMYLCTISKIQI
jgi:uncharacterized membrane protein